MADNPGREAELRQTYAAVLNLIPSIVRMIEAYVCGEESPRQIALRGRRMRRGDCGGRTRPRPPRPPWTPVSPPVLACASTVRRCPPT